MPVVAEIMTEKVAYISDNASLREARTALKDLNVRHLPVVNTDGLLVGMLTQRVVLAEVIKLVDQVGVSGLEQQERQHQIKEIMDTNFKVADPMMDLKRAGQYFLENKHSCLPVIEQGQLVGIVTAQDFVKLCVSLL